MIIMHKLKHKDFIKDPFIHEEYTNKSVGKTVAFCDYDSEQKNFNIYYLHNVNTWVKLHELGHANLGHIGCRRTLWDDCKDELDASLWANSKLVKRISVYNIVRCVSQMIQGKGCVTKTFNLTIKHLKYKGITLTDSEISLFWNTLIKYHKTKNITQSINKN